MNHVLAFDPEHDIERYDDLPVQKLIEGWPPLVKRLFESLTHQGFFQDADRVSLAAFLTGLTFYAINDKEDTAFDVFGVDPNRALTQPIFDKLHSVGGTHLLGSPVTALSHDNERLTKLCIQNNGEEQWLEFDAVVLAMDPANLSKLLKEEAHHLLPYSIIPKGVASAVVRFWFDTTPNRARYATGVFASGHADNFFWLDLLQPPYQDWHDKTGGSVIECHLYGRRAEHAMEHTDKEVLERVRRIVQESWPGLEGHEVHTHLLRNPPTHTVFAPGVMSNLPAMQTQLRNMCLAGDWIQAPFPCLYLERATVTGMVAAQYAAQQAGYDASLLPTPIPPKPPTPSVRLGRKLARTIRTSLPFRNFFKL